MSAGLADALDQLMRRVHSGHATKTEQALLARTAHVPLPTAREGNDDTEAPADSPEQRDEDSIDDLPDDDSHSAPATGFELCDAYEEAATW
ncbi:hypothetical protein ACFUGD_00305 [Streptomyces sp. NPDC057217]|uniref:hypothetical protein n=1 Tax=Streptomyces sp. NPDC057217 TaxID=3346054 RepID=UPI00363FDB5F